MNPAALARQRAQQKWPGATVDRRSRNAIVHRHPADSRKRMVEQHIGPIHYGVDENLEIETAFVPGELADQPWLFKMTENDFFVFVGPGTTAFDSGQLVRYVNPSTAAEITFQPQQLQWSNDLDQIEPIADPQPVAHSSLIDDRVVWENAFGAGLDFRWQVQPAQLTKQLTVDQLATIGAPSQTIIDGGNPVLKLQFIFEKSAGVEIWIDGVQWGEQQGNSPSTGTAVEFRLGTDPVWFFATPKTVDANGETTVVEQRFRKSGASLFVEIRIPWSLLQTAQFPIEIDPTIEPQVGASGDDFEWREGSTTFSNITTRNNVGYKDATDTFSNAGAHFKNIDAGLDGATVDVAYMIYVAASTDSLTVVNSDFSAVDAQNPTTPTTYSAAETATRTTASVAWDNIGTWTVNLTFNSSAADMASVIQELVDSYDYSSGSESILIYHEDGGSTTTDGTVRQIHSFDRSPSTDAPILHIEYTAGGGGTVGRMYTVSNSVAAVTGVIDLIEINAPSDAVVILHKVIVTQETEFSDAQAEQLDVMIHRGSTSGTGGASPTAAPLEVGDAAFGGTVETGNTTQSTDGTIIHREAFHVSAGFVLPATPEERIVISPSGRIVVSLETAPDDSIDFRVTAYFEEIGG